MREWAGELLTVFEVSDEDGDLRVDLVGDALGCRSLLYEFEDVIERDRNHAVLRRWRDRGIPVLALAEDDVVTLFDPQATIENLLDDLFV